MSTVRRNRADSDDSMDGRGPRMMKGNNYERSSNEGGSRYAQRGRSDSYSSDEDRRASRKNTRRFEDEEDDMEITATIRRKSEVRRSYNNQPVRKSWEENERPTSSFVPRDTSKSINKPRNSSGNTNWANEGNRKSTWANEDNKSVNNGKENESRLRSWNDAKPAERDNYRGGSDNDDEVITNPKVSGQWKRSSNFEEDSENDEKPSIGRSGRYEEAPTSPEKEMTSNEKILSSKIPPMQSSMNSNTSISMSLFNGKDSFVMKAHERGVRTEHVQCVIVRHRGSLANRLYPTYELILEENRKPLIIAQKKELNRTSNYHLFDMTRGQVSSKLSKKSGNYLGKLRAKSANRTEYVLVGSRTEKEEYAGIVFDRMNFINQLKEGSQPRKLSILLPRLDENGVPEPYKTAENESSEDMSDLLKRPNSDLKPNYFLFESKDPVFENGNYRLNFHGRVSVPSVKNFQLVSSENIDDIICQFGKIGEDKFHLDFKAPMNAFQAFALALCQFNL